MCELEKKGYKRNCIRCSKLYEDIFLDCLEIDTELFDKIVWNK